MVRPISNAASNNLSFRFPQYNSNLRYLKDSVVIAQNAENTGTAVFIARQDIPPNTGVSNTAYWTTLFDMPSNVVVDSDGVANPVVQISSSASSISFVNSRGITQTVELSPLSSLIVDYDQPREVITFSERLFTSDGQMISDSEIASLDIRPALENVVDSDFILTRINTTVNPIRQRIDFLEDNHVDSDWVIDRLSELDSDEIVNLIARRMENLADSEFIQGYVNAVAERFADSDWILARINEKTHLDSDWVLNQIPFDPVDSDWVSREISSSIAAAGALDSDAVTNLIDSDYIQTVIDKNTFGTGSVDSDFVIRTAQEYGKVDSDFVNAQIAAQDLLDSDDVKVIIDSDYIQAVINKNTLGSGDGTVDSEFVTEAINALDLSGDVDSDWVLSVANPQVDSDWVSREISDSLSASGMLDSDAVKNIIDSDYVQTVIDKNTFGTGSVDSDWVLRQLAELDSDEIHNLITSRLENLADSDYIQMYVTTEINALDLSGDVDSDWVLRQIPSDPIDSDWVLSVANPQVDSDWVSREISSSVAAAGALDSDAVINIIDSDYIAARVVIPEAGTDSDTVVAIINQQRANIDSDFVRLNRGADSDWVLARLAELDSDEIHNLITSRIENLSDSEFILAQIKSASDSDKALLRSEISALDLSGDVDSDWVLRQTSSVDSDWVLSVANPQVDSDWVSREISNSLSASGMLDSDAVQNVIDENNYLDSDWAIARLNLEENNRIAIGRGTLASDPGSISIGATSADSDSVAIGFGTVAGIGSVSIGRSVIDQATNGVSIGGGAITTSENPVAIGRLTVATRNNATAVGFSADVNGVNGTAIGASTYAQFANSTAIGRQARTTTTNQLMLGTDSDTVVAPGSIQIASNGGRLHNLDSDWVQTLFVIPDSDDFVSSAKIAIDSEHIQSIVDSDYVVDIVSRWIDSDTIALIHDLYDSDYVMTLINSNIDDAIDSVVDSDWILRIINERNDSDINLLRSEILDSENVKAIIDSDYILTSVNKNTFGSDGLDSDTLYSSLKASDAPVSTEIGRSASSSTNAIAIGNLANASQTASIAIGANANAHTGTDTIALGRNANAAGSSAIALGRNARASGFASVAIGENAISTGNYSIMLGDSLASVTIWDSEASAITLPNQLTNKAYVDSRTDSDYIISRVESSIVSTVKTTSNAPDSDLSRDGALWWDTNDAELFIRYEDQWIQASPGGSGGGGFNVTNIVNSSDFNNPSIGSEFTIQDSDSEGYCGYFKVLQSPDSEIGLLNQITTTGPTTNTVITEIGGRGRVMLFEKIRDPFSYN